MGGAPVLGAGAARADEGTLAESLFPQGLAAMGHGDFARACDLLGESQRLDPNGGTLLNLGLCHERAGHVATAWARYHDALGLARRDARPDRITFAEEHIKLLEPRLPRVAIVMSDPVTGARMKVDGAELPASAWERPSPVDPGEHQLRVEAPARRVAPRPAGRNTTHPRLVAQRRRWGRARRRGRARCARHRREVDRRRRVPGHRCVHERARARRQRSRLEVRDRGDHQRSPA